MKMNRMKLVPVLGICLASTVIAGPPQRFDSQLIGVNAAGQAVPTNATGHAAVEVIDDGTAISFQIQVAGIRNLFMAHIHIAPGPVQITDPAGPVAFWFTGGPPPVTTLADRTDGVLARGYIITSGQLVSWDANDPQDRTIQGLIDAIAEGRASVVVHTNDLNPSTPAGRAGDSPLGELRGTLR